jgi:hypothetical protein
VGYLRPIADVAEDQRDFGTLDHMSRLRWSGPLRPLDCKEVERRGAMELTPEWEYVADTVMGGISTGEVRQELVAGRQAAHLTGHVSLENSGGFIQMAFDLAQGDVMDASAWQGIEIEARGLGTGYEMRLRTDQLERPWQSFRAAFDVADDWQTLRLPWRNFEARKTDKTLDPARLRRIGILAYGQEMQADVAVSVIRLFG